MNFSTDRDLLLLEPRVFNDVAFIAQEFVHESDGAVSATTLTSVQADFEMADVDAGSVVLISQVPHEVVERIDANMLTISLPRARTSDVAVPGESGSSQEIIVRTFRQQAALVHDALLRMIGIDPDDSGGLDEDAVISLNLMAKLEALGTLERVYSAAQLYDSMGETDNTYFREKADEYRSRFATARERATILIDVNQDGLAEERRRLGLIRLRRD